jgi:hypothetical protein
VRSNSLIMIDALIGLKSEVEKGRVRTYQAKIRFYVASSQQPDVFAVSRPRIRALSRFENG